jgi:hypothetical protein
VQIPEVQAQEEADQVERATVKEAKEGTVFRGSNSAKPMRYEMKHAAKHTWFALLNLSKVSTHVKAARALTRLSTPPSEVIMLNSFSNAPWKAKTFWISEFLTIKTSQKLRLSAQA